MSNKKCADLSYESIQEMLKSVETIKKKGPMTATEIGYHLKLHRDYLKECLFNTSGWKGYCGSVERIEKKTPVRKKSKKK